MKANPGGTIDNQSIIGRDEVIELIWDTLEQQSILKNAERRIGKTTIIRKMLAEPREGWFPVFQDLEKFHSAQEFALGVYHVVHQFLSKRGKAARRANELLGVIGGTEIKGVTLPKRKDVSWKAILTKSITDLMKERSEDDERLVFLWDEMPFMLSEIRDREGEKTAMEVLDVLRSLRQEHGDLRMVITGSIGIHHVLKSLKDASYANAPFNDILSIEIPPLDDAHAALLAEALIGGESLPSSDLAAAAACIAEESDAFPFYIHHVVKALKTRGLAADPEHIRTVVANQLAHEGDPWELSHYRERIPTYYGEDAATVLLILDHLALQTEPAPIDAILAALKQASEFDERETLLDLLKLLAKDHYLTRSADGGYQFRFPLIQRWWKLDRGL